MGPHDGFTEQHCNGSTAMAEKCCLLRNSQKECGSLHLSEVAHGVIDGLGQVLGTRAVEAGHGNAAVLGHVNLVLVGHVFDLGGCQTREGEHADLVDDEVPVLVRVDAVQVVIQLLPHTLDAAGHALHLGAPLVEGGLIADHLRHDACAVHGRVAVDGTSNPLALTEHLLGGVGIHAKVREGAHPLGVQPQILAVGLCEQQLNAGVSEEAHSGGVLIQAA
mmetsp:Transcript_19690/g.59516  ORF Transcript_19690/g.59516 Transcript_19690/m.59516 type:complete len:220 (+) Transcript_19690:83-742(+)